MPKSAKPKPQDDQAELQAFLKSHPDWQDADGFLQTCIEFDDFDSAVNFIGNLKPICQILNHHPDVYLFDYKFVQLMLSSHDQQKITDADIHLATQIDKLLKIP